MSDRKAERQWIYEFMNGKWCDMEKGWLSLSSLGMAASSVDVWVKNKQTKKTKPNKTNKKQKPQTQ